MLEDIETSNKFFDLSNTVHILPLVERVNHIYDHLGIKNEESSFDEDSESVQVLVNGANENYDGVK